MPHKIFLSLNYKLDSGRAEVLRKLGNVQANKPATDAEWETVIKGGEDAIRNWIDAGLAGRDCTVVLIGAGSSRRKWIDYEIQKSWDDGKGVLGIHVHNIKDKTGKQTTRGVNPFESVTMVRTGSKLSGIVKAYDPPYTASPNVLGDIEYNLDAWVEEAIAIRRKH